MKVADNQVRKLEYFAKTAKKFIRAANRLIYEQETVYKASSLAGGTRHKAALAREEKASGDYELARAELQVLIDDLG